jgi:hypothetical protein
MPCSRVTFTLTLRLLLRLFNKVFYKWGGSNKTLRVQKKFKTLLCAAVGAASLQYGSDAYTMCRRSGTMLKNDKGVPKLSA